MPLYALERSIEEMALEPPKAKNEAYWRSIEVIVISLGVRSSRRSVWSWISKSRKMGMFVTRDSVMRKSVKRSWSGQRRSIEQGLVAPNRINS